MRLFVAVWPSEDVVEALRRLPRPDAPAKGIRWTRPEQWHVTIRFLGDVADDEVGAIAAEWQARATRHAPRTVHAGPATSTFGRSVLIVPVRGVEDLLALDVGDDRGDGGEGHLTLARSRTQDLRRLKGEPFDAQWLVDELTLVCSQTRADGAVYDVIERWPLSGGSIVVG